MKTILATGVIAIFATAAAPQDMGDTSIALGLSSLGGNIEAAYRIDPSMRVRGIFIGGASADYEESDADGEFEGSVDLGGVALMGDYYPNQGGWRVSGGLFFSNTEISATGTAEIDGLGTESVTTMASFENDIAPMITTGYDWAFADGWSFNSEIGVIFTGGIDVSFTATDTAVQDQVDDDPELQDLRDDAADVSAFPYIGLTVAYQF